MTSPHTQPPDFEAWLADHPDLTPADLEPPWRMAEGADPLDEAPAPDPARIRMIQATLERAAATDSEPRPALRLITSSRFTSWMGVAAAVALLLAVGVGLWLQWPTTVTAPEAAYANITLPDGSEIHLNSESSLTYTHSFGLFTRHVELDGEAFFDVATSETPFVIETFNSTVTVLGTSFNVRARANGEASTAVSVKTGRVRVTAKHAPDQDVVLTAGQASHVERTTTLPTPPAPAKLDEAMAWRNGSFIFYNRTYGFAFDEIERRFGIEITAPDDIRALPLTYSKHGVEDDEILVSQLCKTAQISAHVNLRFRATANGFEVYEDR
ncbi:MAG: FecR family protein [Rhodothermales bacterium]